MSVLLSLQSFTPNRSSPLLVKVFPLNQVYFTQVLATINGLPAQTLIIALIAAVFTILLKIGDKSVKQEQGL